MKKIFSMAVCILLLGSLFMTVGTVIAFEPGFELTEVWAMDVITPDGAWTNSDEWSAGEVHYVGTPQKGVFVMVLDTLTTGVYNMAFLVEFADGTADAGDIIQLCLNPGTESTVPTAMLDYKIEITGLTTVKTYEGTGSGWAEITPDAEVVQAAATMTTSAHDSSTHVVAEFVVDKGTLMESGAPPQGVRIGMYDASSDSWLAWPPASSADNPMTWGLLSGYQQDPWPEGLTIGVMLALSSVAAIVSLRYFKKPPKL